MNIKKSQSIQCNLPLQQPNQWQIWVTRPKTHIISLLFKCQAGTTHLESYNRAQGENSVAVKHFLTKIIAFKKELNAAGASVPSEKRRPFQSALHFHRKLSLMRSWLNPQGVMTDFCAIQRWLPMWKVKEIVSFSLQNCFKALDESSICTSWPATRVPATTLHTSHTPPMQHCSWSPVFSWQIQVSLTTPQQSQDCHPSISPNESLSKKISENLQNTTNASLER